MSKKKEKEAVKTEKKVVEKTEEQHNEQHGFGGLPDRDLKKSLGCGG